MHITEKRTNFLISALLHGNSGSCFVTEYGEQGYTCDKGILLADWNEGSCTLSERAQSYLEEAGYTLEWLDEWTIVDERAYRVQGDSPWWRPSAVLPPEHYEYVTPHTDTAEVIELFTIRDSRDIISLLPHWITKQQLREAGYTLWNTQGVYQSGFHSGQSDDPRKLAELFLEYEGVESVLFQCVSANMFETSFNAWTLSDDDNAATD